jgi:hypothetical protein
LIVGTGSWQVFARLLSRVAGIGKEPHGPFRHVE